MSDPVTNAEIEDVLSSIRRLVSEDSRGAVRQRVHDQPQATDRLVLTPSLRVAVDDTEIEEPDPHIDADEAGADEVTGVEVLVSEGTAEPSEPDADALDAEPAAVAGAPWTDPDATLYATAAEFSLDAEMDESAAVEGPEEAPGQEESEAMHWPEEDSAEPQVDESAPDPGDEPEADDTSERDLEWEDAGEDQEQEAEAASRPDQDAPDLAEAVEVLAAAMDGSAPQDWEPQGEEMPAADTGAESTIAWQDEPTPDPDAGVLDDAADENDTTDGTDLFDEDDTVLDEASLRELVTDIVREELQGALGERITRNVRKLVRREINRALSVQDLE